MPKPLMTWMRERGLTRTALARLAGLSGPWSITRVLQRGRARYDTWVSIARALGVRVLAIQEAWEQFGGGGADEYLGRDEAQGRNDGRAG